MPDPEFDPGDRLEIRKLDEQLERMKRRGGRALALARELRWMLLLNLAMIVPMIAGYWLIDRGNAEEWDRAGMISTYAAIVASVMAAWGLFRSTLGWGIPERGKIFVLYTFLFGMTLVFFGTLLLLMLNVAGKNMRP